MGGLQRSEVGVLFGRSAEKYSIFKLWIKKEHIARYLFENSVFGYV